MFVTQVRNNKSKNFHRANSADVGLYKKKQTVPVYHQRKSVRYMSQHINSKPSSTSNKIPQLKFRKCFSFRKKTTTLLPTAWQKIMSQYNMFDKMEKCYEEKVRPGISFYKSLMQVQSMQQQYFINFPDTVIMDNEANLKLLYTNKQGILSVKNLQKNQYFTVLHDRACQTIQSLRGTPKYKQHYDYKENPHAPIVISKISQDSNLFFETQIETYRTFLQKKPKATRNKYVQRYIYGRNMKALIIRHCYQSTQLGQQKVENYANRYQNVQQIFKYNAKADLYQTHKLFSLIFLSTDRPHSINVSKITNEKGLQKFIKQTQEIKKFLEKAYHVVIKKLLIDYTVDLYDQPWVINLKYIQTDKTRKSIHSLSMIGSTRNCRLCNKMFPLTKVQKMLSTKMIYQFVEHLKKRTKVQDQNLISFINDISVNSKQHKTCHTCNQCYQIVMMEIQLKNYQEKLARITNIKPKQQSFNKKKIQQSHFPAVMKQWRFMIYVIDVHNFELQGLHHRPQQIAFQYRLGQNIEESWKCNTRSDIIDINKLKIHYFFSTTNDIEEFLKQTELSFAITKGPQCDTASQIICNGSTSIISNFKNRFPISCGQRQTTTVLLFFQNRKYCELTLKIGLICDGGYYTKDIHLTKNKNIFFPEKTFINSNPFPKQWIQIFTDNYEQIFRQKTYSEVAKTLQCKKKTSKKLQKRPFILRS